MRPVPCVILGHKPNYNKDQQPEVDGDGGYLAIERGVAGAR